MSFTLEFSAGDGSNNEGSQETYALTSGSDTIDDELTFNNKPTTGETPIAVFLPFDPASGTRFQLGDFSNGDSLLYTQDRTDFDCPTQLTGWEVLVSTVLRLSVRRVGAGIMVSLWRYWEVMILGMRG